MKKPSLYRCPPPTCALRKTSCTCGEPFDSDEWDYEFPCVDCCDIERRIMPYKKKGTGTAQERQKNRQESIRIRESCPYAIANKRWHLIQRDIKIDEDAWKVAQDICK